MKTTKLYLATIATLLCSLTASAHDFEVDGIYYDITSSTDLTVSVTYQGDSYSEYSNEYSGAVTIPSTITYNGKTYSVTSIGHSAFRYCSSLTSIIIPEGVTGIGPSAFSGCSSLTSIVVEEGNTIYDSRNGCNAIIETNSNTLIAGCSSTVFPDGVTSIGGSAFYGCSSLTSITIPEGVTSIGPLAFVDCSSLKEVIFEDGSETLSLGVISDVLFSNCPLENVYLGRNLSYNSGGSPFYGKTKLTTVTIGGDVTSIGHSAFRYCSSLASITIPEGVTSIGEYAFRGCSCLTTITIPESVTSIGENAFNNCTNLYKVLNFSDLDIQKGSWSNGSVAYYAQKVVKADGVIDDYIFTLKDGVYCLSDYIGTDVALTLPEDYDGDDYEIYELAFLDNDTIVSVIIPQTVGTVGKSAFAGCDKLATVSLARGVMSIEDNAFENCTSLTSIQYPESLKTIGEEAFSGCSGLKDLFFSAKIETYGEDAFEGCTEVETITVMGNVMPTVPSDKLTSITLVSPVPLKTEPFANKVYRNATLYVPEGSLSRYQSADVWEDFWTIKEFDPTGIEDVTVDEDADAPIYTMKGVRVNGTRSTLPAGLYIQNGKKFVVM